MSTNIEREDWSPDMSFGGAALASAAADGGGGPVGMKLDLPKGKKELEKMTASRVINYDQWKEALIRLGVSCYGGWEDASTAGFLVYSPLFLLCGLLRF